jgi:hypothetical protein
MTARLQHPSYSLEDRKTKPASSDEVDAFATLALATRSKRQRERTFCPRPSTFRRTDSSSALPLYAARTAPAFDIFQDAESPEDAFEAAVGNCVDYASGKLEFRYARSATQRAAANDDVQRAQLEDHPLLDR